MLVELDGCELRTGRLVDGPPGELTPVRKLPKRKRITAWRDTRFVLARPMSEVDPSFVGDLASYADVTQDLFGVAALRGLSSHRGLGRRQRHQGSTRRAVPEHAAWIAPVTN